MLGLWSDDLWESEVNKSSTYVLSFKSKVSPAKLEIPSNNQVKEKAVAPHSSTLAWRIPWMEEPGRLQSMGSLRVGHNWAISLSRTGEGNGNPLQCSCLENPRDGRAWWADVCGVAQSQTRLKWLSSSSSSNEVNSIEPNSESLTKEFLGLWVHVRS